MGSLKLITIETIGEHLRFLFYKSWEELRKAEENSDKKVAKNWVKDKKKVDCTWAISPPNFTKYLLKDSVLNYFYLDSDSSIWRKVKVNIVCEIDV